MDETISTYTRAQAIEDGLLFDVSATAREAGFVYPVAVSSALWHDYITPPEGLVGQDADGRLWDVLTMLKVATKQIPSYEPGNVVTFSTLFLMKPRRLEKVRLRSLCHPGDNREPVIAIFLEREDPS